MNVVDKLKWRYATKKFDNTRTLPETKVQVLKEAFNLTATSYGLQPVTLLVISDKALQQQLVSCSMNQQQVAQASHLLVFCVSDQIDTDYINAYFDRVKAIRNTPDDILKPFKDYLVQDFDTKSADAVRLWATKQAYLAMGNLLTVCALEDIDACPMEGFDPQAYDQMLGLNEKGLHTVLVMPVGYRASDDMFAGFAKVRKPLEDAVIDWQDIR